MRRAGDDIEFLVVRILAVLHHIGVGVAAHIAGMRLIAVDHQNGGADLLTQKSHRLNEYGQEDVYN